MLGHPKSRGVLRRSTRATDGTSRPVRRVVDVEGSLSEATGVGSGVTAQEELGSGASAFVDQGAIKSVSTVASQDRHRLVDAQVKPERL